MPMAVVGILGCGAFFIICFLIVAIFVAYRVGQENTLGARRSNSIFEPAAPPRTAGKIEKVGEAAGGWSEYRIGDFGLTMSLPATPQQEEMMPDTWSARLKSGIETFAGYEALYPNARIDMEGYLYRVEFPDEGSDWVVKGDLEKIKQRGGYADIKQTHHPRVVAGQPAVEVDYTYTYDGTPSISREIILVGPRSVRTIAFTYWKRQDAAASVDFEQCVNSIKFLPAAEDKFGVR
jgi:hypothetical protein